MRKSENCLDFLQVLLRNWEKFLLLLSIEKHNDLMALKNLLH